MFFFATLFSAGFGAATAAAAAAAGFGEPPLSLGTFAGLENLGFVGKLDQSKNENIVSNISISNASLKNLENIITINVVQPPYSIPIIK